jgi:predicted kinase
MLIAFCGLPGAGKTTLACRLAQQRQATYLRIDVIEEALLADGGAPLVERGAGYRVAYAVAEENLKLGRTVIADCVNPLKITREAWGGVARRAGVELVDVVVICSDGVQHKRRVEARPSGTRGSVWVEILNRAFEATEPAAIVIDTAHRTVEQCLAVLDAALPTRQA